MKAKDTVMKMRWMTKVVQEDQDRLLLQQAEISFKAGIKEVVEWVWDNVMMDTDSRLALETKLKEWGIEDDNEK